MYIRTFISLHISYKRMSDIDNRDRKKRKPENDKGFLNDGLSTADIRKTIDQIRAYLEKGGSTPLEDRVTKLQSDYPFFVERYPVLFDMAIRPDFNYEFLNYFLSKRDDIIADRISTDDASRKVGQEWFDRFVDVSKLSEKK